MSDERIAEIKALLEQITQGDWDFHPTDEDFFITSLGVDNVGHFDGGAWDIIFIAAAPTIVRELLEEVERLRQSTKWAEMKSRAMMEGLRLFSGKP